MSVVRIVRGIPQALRNGTSEKKRVDAVVNRVRLGLVKCKDNECPVIIECRIGQERGKPELQPVRCEVDGSVMSVIYHVRRNEHPLRDSGSVHVGRKVVEITVALETRGNGNDRVVQDRRVVLADVVRVGGVRAVEIVRRGVAVQENERSARAMNESGSCKYLLEALISVSRQVLHISGP